MEFPKVNINFLLNTGGLGDNICALPAMKYIMETYPWVTSYLYVPDYFLPLARNMLPGIISRPFSKGNKFFNGKWPGRQTKLEGHDSLSTHLVDYNFNCLANKQVDIKFKNYCKLDLEKINIESFRLPEEYVVITTGYTAPIRKFPAHTVNALVDYFTDRNIKVVFLGSKEAVSGGYVGNILGEFSQEIDYTKGIDLINKTSLLEAGKIIANSKCIIGIDNGLMHVAACSDVPIIGGYTSVDPIIRLPYRNSELGWNCHTVIPPDSEPDKFCQSRIDFLYNHDFRFSFDKSDNLVNSLTAKMFIAQIEKIV